VAIVECQEIVGTGCTCRSNVETVVRINHIVKCQRR